ncbi:hypothetical protein [uncultured Friedmanniella sp.]|uniref:hypothetical protein n=1 Tax=uncultured Friedmanniella sp. TaxID=335381 RepID=UPI0035CB513F
MRRSLAALACLGLLAVPLRPPVPAAAGADGCTAPVLVSSTVAPPTLVVGTASPTGFVFTASVRKNGCTVEQVDTEVVTATGAASGFRLDEQETIDGVTTYDVGIRVDPGAVVNAEAGAWTSTVSVTSDSTTTDGGPRLRVVRAARLSSSASPEPVRAGRTLTVRGRLTRADWSTLGYAGYARRPVELQFRTADGSYRTVKDVASGSRGAVRASVRATQDGCYRFAFRGSSTTARVVSRGDCVGVR